MSKHSKFATPENGPQLWIGKLRHVFSSRCNRVPNELISLLARFSIAAVFWKSGQTKIEGMSIDIVSGNFTLGWPRLSESAIPLFQDEYRLPIIPADLAAMMAAWAEHLFPILILIGLATRISSLALLGMTLVIQIFVYPDAYPTHGVWMVALLFLIGHGPGQFSVDYWAFGRRPDVPPFSKFSR